MHVMDGTATPPKILLGAHKYCDHGVLDLHVCVFGQNCNMPKELDSASMMCCSMLSNPNTKPLVIFIDALNQVRLPASQPLITAGTRSTLHPFIALSPLVLRFFVWCVRVCVLDVMRNALNEVL